MSNEVRWKQRFANLDKALKKLDEATDLMDYSDLERSGLVQTFEYTYELAWKTLKDLLNYEGYDADSPRAVIKVGFQHGFLTDEDDWIEALESRNVLTHTYDEATADKAVRLIKGKYHPMIVRLYESLKARL